MRPHIEYDENEDTLKIEGVVYACELFRTLGLAKVGTWIRITQRSKNGSITVLTVDEKMSKNFDDIAKIEVEQKPKLEAPWKDFKGQPIHEGDLIQHPDGTRGKVVHLPNEKLATDAWRVTYDNGRSPILNRLCLQIDNRGRAVVVK